LNFIIDDFILRRIIHHGPYAPLLCGGYSIKIQKTPPFPLLQENTHNLI